MLCPSCGKDVGEDVGLCVECAERKRFFGDSVTEHQSSAESTRSHAHLTRPEVKMDPPAGFFKRVMALFLDSALLLFFLLVFDTMIKKTRAGFSQVILEDLSREFRERDWDIELTQNHIEVALLCFAVCVMGWIYFSVLESSPFRATPGKRAFGLRVVDHKGDHASFLRAGARNLFKLLSALPLGFGFIVAAFTEKGQAFHDLLSDCFVVQVRRVSLVWSSMMSLLAVFLLLALPPLFRGVPAGDSAEKSLVLMDDISSKMRSIESSFEDELEQAVDNPVRGTVLGRKFSPSTIEYSHYVKFLTFRGNSLGEELEVQLFLFLDELPEEGDVIRVTESSEGDIPHVHVKRKGGGRQTKVYSKKGSYSLSLVFREVGDNYFSGSIVLEVFSSPKTSLNGAFTARIK